MTAEQQPPDILQKMRNKLVDISIEASKIEDALSSVALPYAKAVQVRSCIENMRQHIGEVSDALQEALEL